MRLRHPMPHPSILQYTHIAGSERHISIYLPETFDRINGLSGYRFSRCIASSPGTYRAFPEPTIPSASSSRNTDSVSSESLFIALQTRSPTAHLSDAPISSDAAPYRSAPAQTFVSRVAVFPQPINLNFGNYILIQ